MKTTFAEELAEASPVACAEAGIWVESMASLTDNEIWKVCTRGDWLFWLLLDAFSLSDEGYQTPRYYRAVISLRKVLGYGYGVPFSNEELADRIHKIFPEWPL